MPSCVMCAHPATLQCSACHSAAYCGQEHQSLAWKKHKKLCQILQKRERGEPTLSKESYCGVCGDADGPLRKTRCCKKTICDDYQKFQMYTHMRASCARNHDNYTACCFHHDRRHGGDWKTCDKCMDQHEPEMRAWYRTNSYNFLEDIDPDPPAFTPEKCKACGVMVKKGSEGSSRPPSGGIQCEVCMFKNLAV